MQACQRCLQASILQALKMGAKGWHGQVVACAQPAISAGAVGQQGVVSVVTSARCSAAAITISASLLSAPPTAHRQALAGSCSLWR